MTGSVMQAFRERVAQKEKVVETHKDDDYPREAQAAATPAPPTEPLLYLQSLTSNKCMALKVIAVLLTFAAVFVVLLS